MKPIHQNRLPVSSQRLQFDVLDLFRAAAGFERPEGYVVIPQDIGKKVEEEFVRLYEIEEAAQELAEQIDEDVMPLNCYESVDRIKKLTGLL